MTKREAEVKVQEKIAEAQAALDEAAKLCEEHDIRAYFGELRYISKSHWAAADYAGEWVSSSTYADC